MAGFIAQYRKSHRSNLKPLPLLYSSSQNEISHYSTSFNSFASDEMDDMMNDNEISE